MSHSHFDIVCEKCGTRIGGCRCMESNKTQRKEGFCSTCEYKARESKRAEGETQGPSVPGAKEFLERALELFEEGCSERGSHGKCPAYVHEDHSPDLYHNIQWALEALASPGESKTGDPARDEERPTYEEVFLKAVWTAFDERHPCFTGDCDHRLGKDCELAIKDSAREMVEEYFAPKAPAPTGAREVDPEALTTLDIEGLACLAALKIDPEPRLKFLEEYNRMKADPAVLEWLRNQRASAPRGTGEAR